MAKRKAAVLLSTSCALLFSAISACAPAMEQIYAAPSHETVLSYLEASQTGDAQNLFVENQSSEEIYLLSVSLRDCQNIRNRCETTVMRRLIRPREKFRVMTIQPLNDNARTSVSYATSWEAAVSIPVIP